MGKQCETLDAPTDRAVNSQTASLTNSLPLLSTLYETATAFTYNTRRRAKHGRVFGARGREREREDRLVRFGEILNGNLLHFGAHDRWHKTLSISK